jgi:hypothetical protein
VPGSPAGAPPGSAWCEQPTSAPLPAALRISGDHAQVGLHETAERHLITRSCIDGPLAQVVTSE